MKKALSIVLILALCLALAGPALADSSDFVIEDGVLKKYTGSDTEVVIPEGVTAIGANAFSERTELKSVVIPEGVTGIGSSAFANCWALESVTLPESLTRISDFAFASCYALEDIAIPAAVSTIGSMAFSRTPWLDRQEEFVVVNGILIEHRGLTPEEVTIPDGVTRINSEVFYGAEGLAAIHIPASVKSIGDFAFFMCEGLSDVYFGGSEAQWEAIEFGDMGGYLFNATVHFGADGPVEEAPVVVLSPQKLMVNWTYKDVEKYNINGSNYFKLRDIAYLLNNTPAQFSVGWDGETGTVSIVTGEPYVLNGSEMIVGADKSATAVASAQTIQINGEVRDDLSVYNLDGNNFFKLRDLGAALGFGVDYDSADDCALIFTA